MLLLVVIGPLFAALNTAWTLPAGDAATVTVENTKTPLPPTGGVGTMMFFVIGGSLIAAAGVLLVVVLKKRAK